MSHTMTQKELYNYIYTRPDANGKLYGFSLNRLKVFVDYILKTIPKGSSVLDVGCGRGFLIRYLLNAGYKASGTEIIDECVDLVGLPVQFLPCEELCTLPDNSFDAITCGDVIEHLEDTSKIHQAFKDFGRISKKYVLISTGGVTSGRNPFSKETGVPDLHNVIIPAKYWTEIFEQYFNLSMSLQSGTTLYLFGEVK